MHELIEPYWTSSKIEDELDKLQSRGFSRHTVTPLLYRIRDHYEEKIADMPFLEQKRIEALERKIQTLEAYIEQQKYEERAAELAAKWLGV